MARTAKTSSGGTARKPRTTPAKTAAKTSADASAKRKSASAAQAAAGGAEAVSADATPAPAKSSGSGWLIFLLIVGLIGAGGYLSYPKWYPKIADKIPAMPKLPVEDPRVSGLSARIASLETKTGDIQAKDDTIARLQEEREKLSVELTKALTRLETVEKSMDSVRELAEAAASMDEANQAKASLQRLSDRLAALESSGMQSGAASKEGLAQLQAQQARSRELAARLTQLEQDQAASASAETALAGMEKRLSAVEQADASGAPASSRQAALVLAVGQLRDAAAAGGAYQREWDAIKGMAAGDPGIEAALTPLAQYANTGVPTLAVLRGEYGELAGGIVSGARGQSASGWLGKAVARIGSLITVRRTDAGGGDSVEALVAQAESHLRGGDLAAAVKSLEAIAPISADAAAVAAPWLGRAKMRLAAERALAALHIHAVSLLGAGKE